MPSTQEKPRKTRQNKTAFVKSLPADMSAKEVVDRAKKQGMMLGEKYVYVVRSNARRKTGRPKASTKVAPDSMATSGPEKEFRRLALELGVKRAELLLSDTKKKIADIIAGR